MFTSVTAIAILTGVALSRLVLVEYVQVLVYPASRLDKEIHDYTGPYYLNTTFAEQMLEEHNSLREIHGAQPLKWSTELFEFAFRFAISYNCSGILEHSGYKYGENLAFGYSPSGAIKA
ncbi:putative pathogenesis-related protein, partial [Candida tropicalis]